MRTVWTESAHLHLFNFFGKHLTPLMLWLRLGIRLRLGLEYMAGTVIHNLESISGMPKVTFHIPMAPLGM